MYKDKKHEMYQDKWIKGGKFPKESLVLRLWGVLEDNLRVLSTAIITIRSDEGLTLKSNLPTQLIKQIILY